MVIYFILFLLMVFSMVEFQNGSGLRDSSGLQSQTDYFRLNLPIARTNALLAFLVVYSEVRLPFNSRIAEASVHWLSVGLD